MLANKHAKIMLLIVFAILGFMIATQIKTTERQKTINVQRAEELTERLRDVEQQRDELAKEVERLQAASGSDEALESEVERLKEFAGEVPLEGKGIQLILDDSKVTAQVGVSTSEIRCAGPTLSVNNNRSAPPYVILAIGNPSNLASALKLRGGVLDTFKFWGIQADLTQPEVVKVPAFKGRRIFEYAQAAPDEDKAAKEGGK